MSARRQFGRDEEDGGRETQEVREPEPPAIEPATPTPDETPVGHAIGTLRDPNTGKLKHGEKEVEG